MVHIQFLGEEFHGLSEHFGKKLIVHIHSKYLTNKNEQVLERNIWGTTLYTGDSDIVSSTLPIIPFPPHDFCLFLNECLPAVLTLSSTIVLMHSGQMRITSEQPSCFGVGVYLCILPGYSVH